MQPTAVLRVGGTQELLLEMDEGSRQLNQPFVKGVIRTAIAEPEIFEYVVRLVVALVVEAREEARVTGILPIGGLRHEALNEIADAIALFHGAEIWRRTILRVLCMTRCV